MKINEKYITIKKDKFIVHRKFNNLDYQFGEFDSLSQAIEFRNKIDADGWPLKKNTPFFSLDDKKPVQFYINDFINSQIIYLDRNVKENDPKIFDIYQKFNEFIKEDIKIPYKTFKYYFPRTINKKFIKREQLNGSVRYNISFVNDTNKDNSDNNNTDNNNKQLKELHGFNEVIPRLECFINEKIIILDRKTFEDDPILNDICTEFNNYLKPYGEMIKLNSLSNYFSTSLKKHKNADKLVANGKTHYNISFKTNNLDLSIKKIDSKIQNSLIENPKIKYNLKINSVNNISIISIKGVIEFKYFDYLIDQLKNLKEYFISLNIEQKNNYIHFNIQLLENNKNSKNLIKTIKSLFN